MADKSSPSTPSESRPETLLHCDNFYAEGFMDGRRSVALSIAERLLDEMTNERISELTGLPVREITRLRAQTSADASCGNVETLPHEASAEAQSSFSLVRETPSSGTTLVEPRFIQLFREGHNLTQAKLAKLLNVHTNTVGLWESSLTPIRIKTATYNILLSITANAPRLFDDFI